MSEELSLIAPTWHLPPGVHAFVTTRHGGYSTGPWQSFNLAQHVDDVPEAVAANRELLIRQLQQHIQTTDLSMQWVQQVHGTEVLSISSVARVQQEAEQPACTTDAQITPTTSTQISVPVADAIYTDHNNLACAVLTADCLPVLFCSADGSEIAVAHAGWRGLCNGILEATVKNFQCESHQIKAWLGPAIAACHFEVGDEVRSAFLTNAAEADLAATAAGFQAGKQDGKWQADLYTLARIRLQALGLKHIAGEPQCTMCLHEQFYSYRFHPKTGRFATLIVKTHKTS